MLFLFNGLSSICALWSKIFTAFEQLRKLHRLGVYRVCERRGYTTDSRGRTAILGGACAAGVGGAVGSIAGAPFYLVKTRLQAQAAQAIAVGHQHKLEKGTLGVLRDIYVREGVKGERPLQKG